MYLSLSLFELGFGFLFGFLLGFLLGDRLFPGCLLLPALHRLLLRLFHLLLQRLLFDLARGGSTQMAGSSHHTNQRHTALVCMSLHAARQWAQTHAPRAYPLVPSPVSLLERLHQKPIEGGGESRVTCTYMVITAVLAASKTSAFALGSSSFCRARWSLVWSWPSSFPFLSRSLHTWGWGWG